MILREENRVLRTPATSHVVQVPRRAALTTTKVPRFDGTTSWEQYHQVFEAIVRSNGWDNDTAALQLFSHLEGDALNVAQLVPLTRRLSRTGLVDALMAHYGSPGRLADYWRQFEKTTRTVGEDPAIFATALETLAVKAFGDMGRTAQLRLTKPNQDSIYPVYVVGEADFNTDTTRVAEITRQNSEFHQLVDLLRRVLSTAERPTPKPEAPEVEKILQQLVRETRSRPTKAVNPTVTSLEKMLLSFLDGQHRRQRQPQKQRPSRRDWSDVMCFSCGKSGHAATRCPDFNESFPFLQDGGRRRRQGVLL